MKDAPVLLLTHTGDFYTIDLVEEALRSRGAFCLRVNTDGFPSELSLSARFLAGESSFRLRGSDFDIALEEVRAVWARRLWPGRLPAAMEPRFSQHCRKESRTAFFDILRLLERAHWVNPLGPLFAAESKLLQLQRAQEVGLELPDTVVTNDAYEARELYARTGGRAVTKLLGALSQTMNATGDFVYTSLLDDEHMAAIEQVRWCPQVFQTLVPKRHELRVIIVGRRCFAGAVDARGTQGEVDWRLAEPGSVSWTEAELPAGVEKKALALMDRLSLRYGALDLIVDEEGRYVFLELNPAGEWGWLQRDLGLPIAEALADELLTGGEP